MNTNKQGKPVTYENSFKIAVAREYLTGNLGYGTLAKKYGLPGAETVGWFVKWYKKNYREEVQQPDHTEGSQSGNVNSEQIAGQLKQANLKIAGLEMLIETAQKELGVDIVKKPGTKQ